MYGIIYVIRNKINGKIYVGQTKQGSVRKRYKGSITKTQNEHLKKAIEKYGIENFEVIEPYDTALTKEELDAKEQALIAQFKSNDKRFGYNIMSGGHNGTHSEETRKKIGDAQKGELNHMYGKRGKENPRYSRIVTACAYCGKEIEVAQHRSKRNVYNYCSEECRKNSRIHIKPMPRTRVAAICETCGKEYDQFPSVYNNEKHHYCSRDCQNMGYKTLYKGSNNPNFGKHKVAGANNGRAKRVLCVTTGEVFDCAIDAGKKCGINRGLIPACCRGEQKSAGGMVWKYI